MLPKKNLIPLRKEFRSIRTVGKVANGVLFGMIVRQTSEQVAPRFAFVVTKKIDKRSVVRNQVKRKLAAAVALYMESVKEGVDIVFLTKRGLVTAIKEKVESEVGIYLRPYFK